MDKRNSILLYNLPSTRRKIEINQMKKILIVGNFNDEKWIGALIRNVKAADNSLSIDVFNVNYTYNTNNKTVAYCDKIICKTRHFPSFMYSIPKIRGYCFSLDTYKSFREWIEQCIDSNTIYDAVNFHFLRNETLDLSRKLKKIARRIILSPWGTDVLRASKKALNRLKQNAANCDIITLCDNVRFNSEVTQKIGNDKIEYRIVGLGAEVIDNLAKRLTVSQISAKEHLGIADKYVIEIGYNGSKGQNHVRVIEAIASIRDRLPGNLCIVLPMTYGLTAGYKHELVSTLSKFNLDYKLYTEYLSTDDVFYLRRCSDIFIHAQKTDANSASLAEYMICQITVVNASWLSYKGRESYGKPYYEFDSFNNLPQAILRAHKGGSLVSSQLVNDLKKLGWSFVAPKWVNLYKDSKDEL